MSVERLKNLSGVSLIESMIAVTVLSVAVVGASAFRYYSALDVREADRQAAAARVAILLCESWQGAADTAGYNLVTLLGSDLTISAISGHKESDPDWPAGFTLLGNYKITSADGAEYYATLAWKNVYSDFKAINVVVAWSQSGTTGGINNADKSFKLTGYVPQL